MKSRTKTDWNKRITYALVRLIESLNDDQDLSFYQIAEELYTSPYHFHKVFKQLTGETVARCIKRLRLERASIYLMKTDKRIEEIAYLSGYETPEGFTKAFKKAYGLQPSNTRKFDAWNYRLTSQAGIHYEEKPTGKWFFQTKGDENMDITVVDLNPFKLLYLEGIGDYWGMQEKWQQFHGILQQNRLYPREALFLSVFFDHDDSIPIPEKHWGVCMSVPEKPELNDALKFVETEGGLYAILTYQGSYEEIGPTWAKWEKDCLPESGWTKDSKRPSFEWYQNSFTMVQPELLLTYLCVPVKKMD